MQILQRDESTISASVLSWKGELGQGGRKRNCSAPIPTPIAAVSTPKATLMCPLQPFSAVLTAFRYPATSRIVASSRDASELPIGGAKARSYSVRRATPCATEALRAT